MAKVSLPYGFKRQTDSPVDSDYLNNGVPYTSVSEVNTAINIGIRHIGLTVNINNKDYWYKDGTADNDLVLKQSDSNNFIDDDLISSGSTYSSEKIENTFAKLENTIFTPLEVSERDAFDNVYITPLSGTTGTTITWRINQQLYSIDTSISSVFINIIDAADGYKRKDLIYVDVNGFNKVQGTESEDIADEPQLPPDSIRVTVIDVDGDVVIPEPPAPPDLSGFLTITAAEQAYTKRLMGNYFANGRYLDIPNANIRYSLGSSGNVTGPFYLTIPPSVGGSSFIQMHGTIMKFGGSSYITYLNFRLVFYTWTSGTYNWAHAVAYLDNYDGTELIDLPISFGNINSPSGQHVIRLGDDSYNWNGSEIDIQMKEIMLNNVVISNNLMSGWSLSKGLGGTFYPVYNRNFIRTNMITPNYFLGVYTSLANLQSAHPTGQAGQYAIIDEGVGEESQMAIWDNDDNEWIIASGTPTVVSVNGQVGEVVLDSSDLIITGMTGTTGTVVDGDNISVGLSKLQNTKATILSGNTFQGQQIFNSHVLRQNDNGFNQAFHDFWINNEYRGSVGSFNDRLNFTGFLSGDTQSLFELYYADRHAKYYGTVEGANPVNAQDFTTKGYVETINTGKVSKSGDTMTGALIISATTESSGTTTGALVVNGGAGFGKKVTSKALRVTDYAGGGTKIITTDNNGDTTALYPVSTPIVTNSTVITQLTTGANWNASDVYIGSAISGVFQMQYYVNTDYWYYMYDDTTPIRIPRRAANLAATDAEALAGSLVNKYLTPANWTYLKAQVNTIGGAWVFSNTLGLGVTPNALAYLTILTPTASKAQILLAQGTTDYTGAGNGLVWNNGGEIKFIDNSIVNRFDKVYNNELFKGSGNRILEVNQFGDKSAVNTIKSKWIYNPLVISGITGATYGANKRADISVSGYTVEKGQRFYNVTGGTLYEAYDDNKVMILSESFDTVPTASSFKPVTSDGIKTALDGKSDKINITTSGTSTAYTGLISGFTTYTDGQIFVVKFHINCGNAPTLNINGLGAKTILYFNTTALVSGNVVANYPYILVYNSSDNTFRIIGVLPINYFDSRYIINTASFQNGDFNLGGTGRLDTGFGLGIAPNSATWQIVLANTTAKSQLRLSQSTVDVTTPANGDIWNNTGELKFMENSIVNRVFKWYNNELGKSDGNYVLTLNQYGDASANLKVAERWVYDDLIISGITGATYTSDRATISVSGKTLYQGQKYDDGAYSYEAYDDNKVRRW